MIKTPSFWYSAKTSFYSLLLLPFSLLYFVGQKLHYLFRKLRGHYKSDARIVCIGNVTAGGAGKTPVVLAIYDLLAAAQRRPAILSRGYGGNLHQPHKVNIAQHSVRDVGDEALMIARKGKDIWVSKKRIKAVPQIEKHADIILMDDGFQNPAITKDRSLMVFNGQSGIGNGHLIPAGPLRQSVKSALGQCDGVIIVGADETGLEKKIRKLKNDMPFFYANIEPDREIILGLKGEKVTAFAGIGLPDKFFDMLKDEGVELSNRIAFPDHHSYGADDIEKIIKVANGNKIVTTEKDFVRLPEEFKAGVLAAPIGIQFSAPDNVRDFILYGGGA